jgi:uncharacterized LabA/DUF88 family protein
MKPSNRKLQNSEPIVYAFIDSQNLNLGIKSQGWKLDWRKFRQYLKNKYHVSKAYLFIGHVAGNEQLYTSLQEFGFIIIFKPTLEIKNKEEIKIKGNVDAELVLHSMIQFNNYKKAIIASGDGDFHCLIEYLASQDKLLRIFTPNKYYSSLLRKFNQYILRVDLLKNSLKFNPIKKTKISGRSKP